MTQKQYKDWQEYKKFVEEEILEPIYKIEEALDKIFNLEEKEIELFCKLYDMDSDELYDLQKELELANSNRELRYLEDYAIEDELEDFQIEDSQLFVETGCFEDEVYANFSNLVSNSHIGSVALAYKGYTEEQKELNQEETVSKSPTR